MSLNDKYRCKKTVTKLCIICGIRKTFMEDDKFPVCTRCIETVDIGTRKNIPYSIKKWMLVVREYLGRIVGCALTTLRNPQADQWVKDFKIAMHTLQMDMQTYLEFDHDPIRYIRDLQDFFNVIMELVSCEL